MYILANMWFTTLMRQFFFNIDKVVFNFISHIYNLLIAIARTSILSQTDIADMTGRIYKLLAVFMIFKVILSLITYVVNPDDFTDKSKGVAKLGTNIIISLALLILTPYIFNYAYQLQTIILEDNSLGTLIFGEQPEEDFFTSAGDDMAFITMSPFFTPDVSIEAMFECTELTTRNPDKTVSVNNKCSGLKDDMSQDTSVASDKSMYSLVDEERFSEQTLKNYVAGVKTGNLSLMFRQDIAVATDKDNEFYIIDYKYLFSTVVGVVVVLLLITFCMDVGLRSIKLAFLQLIAPIPILSYVDPKSGKDGMFKKWYEMCFKTYISLFIKLLALYFAVYIISKVADFKLIDIVNGSYVTNAFISIFIIIGALMFAKDFTKILEGLGIKLDGGFTFNPIKKLENQAVGGKALSKAASVPFKYGARAAKGLGTAALVGGAAAITGQGFRGMGKAFGGAMKGEKFGKNFSNSYAAAKARKKQVDEMAMDEINPMDVRLANLYNRTHGMTKQERNKALDGRMESVKKSWDSISGTIDAVDVEAKSLKAKVEGIRQAGAAQFTDDSANGGLSSQDKYQQAIKAAEDALDQRRKDVAANLSLLDDGTSDGSGGGMAARAKISQEIKTRNENIEFINNQKITYEAADGSTRTIKIDPTQNIKTVSKSMQGEQGAWQASSDYKKVENIAKYTNKPKG